MEADLKSENMYVVGVGTSAGGIDALSKMLGSFNGQEPNMCVIIAQHLSPEHKSELPGILKRVCKWSIVRIEDDMEVEAQTVYVTPANRNVTFSNNKIMLNPLSPDQQYHPSIDDLLISIAESCKQYGIGILLSGTASDGTKGIEAIKGHGGLTMVQTPKSAKFTEMLESAIRTEKVDMVLYPSYMYDEILHYITNHRVVIDANPPDRSIDTIFELLAKRTGTDFSKYKQTTIHRRIKKRIEALQLNSIEAYCEKLINNPVELDNLFNTVLIGVTEFFRNPDAFDALREQVQELLAEKSPEEGIRVWSVGCATGEEPYSLAIMFHELLGNEVFASNLQIFASDIDYKAVSIARKGFYPQNQLQHLDDQILQKYFDKSAEGYTVKKIIKQHILFSRHDISSDPPFIKLDLIVCRNMLIYFNADLQKETLQIFNYSLKKHGLLFLGKSESVNANSGLFEKSKTGKIFRKSGIVSNVRKMNFSKYLTKEKDSTPKIETEQVQSILEAAKDVLFRVDEKPFVIINENGDLKEVRGSVRLYLEVKPGQYQADIFKMANPELVTDIRALLMQVVNTGNPGETPVIKFNVFNRDYYVRIRVVPFKYRNNENPYFIILFENIPADSPYLVYREKHAESTFENFRIAELEQEVRSLRDNLNSYTSALESSSEEMQVVNEELQSANEEMRSSNEELQTSNEELQSTNEELHTSNNELRIANEQLIEKEAELKSTTEKSIKNEVLYRTISENIPNGTIGLANSNLDIEYFAGKAIDAPGMKVGKNQVLNLGDWEVAQLDPHKIHELFSETLQGKSGSVNFVYKDRHFILNTLPVQFPGNQESKVLFLTQEITKQIEQERKVIENEFNFKTLAENIPVMCWTAQADGYIKWYNNRWYEYTGTTPEMMEGWGWQRVHDPVKLPEVMEIWQRSINSGEECELTFPLKGKDGKFRTFLTRIIPLKDQAGNVLQWFGTNTDIDEKRAETEMMERLVSKRTKDLTESNRLLAKRNAELDETKTFLQLLINSSVEYISVLDTELNFITVNSEYSKLMGLAEAEILGKNIVVISPEVAGSPEYHHIKAALNGEHVYMESHASRNRPEMFVETYFIPLILRKKVQGVIIMKRDVTHILQAEKILEAKNRELNRSNEDLQQFAHVASHDLKEPVRKIRTFTTLLQELLPTEGLSKEVPHYMQRIVTATDRMYAMIDGVLNYSSIDSKAELNEQVDLNKILKDIKEDLEVLITTENISVNSDKLPTVTGAYVLLYQVLYNLLKNSIKFARQDVNSYISVLNGVDTDGNSQSVTIIVEDNGIGFEPENAENIFGTFTRLHAKEKYEGTGLGLALCRKIVQRHGGTIKADGTPGVGARFTIVLPI